MTLHRPRTQALLLAIVLGTFAIAASLPVAAHARAKDPVVAAINASQVAKRITPAEGRRLRRTWALSARAQRTARTSSRRRSIADVRRYTTGLARSRALTADRLEPALLSVQATTWTMLKAKRFPSHEQEVEIPGEVVVFTYYWGRGVQFQPFETFKQGLRELNRAKPDHDAARAIADRMLELGVPRGPALTWEYYFPFGGPARPWTSSISQAIATEFYHRVAQAAPEERRATYAAAAEGAARSFQLSTRRGGVASRQGKGLFYVMYPFHPSQRILNGHLQVLVNLNRYARASGSQVAARVVRAGINGVLPIMRKFDTGAWSNYQPGQEAELGYHEFQAEQLVKLGDELEHPGFAEYGARFTRYLETPPTIGFPSSAYAAIFAARDGFRDSTTVRWTIDKRARVTMVVRDEEGREVQRMSTWRGRGTGALVWNGLDAKRRPVAPGNYRAEITATDVAGNRGRVALERPLRVLADTVPPTLRLVTLRERGRLSVITVNALDVFSASVTVQLRIDGKVVASRRGRRVGNTTLVVRRPMSAVKRGELVVRDTSGNETVHPLAAG